MKGGQTVSMNFSLIYSPTSNKKKKYITASVWKPHGSAFSALFSIAEALLPHFRKCRVPFLPFAKVLLRDVMCTPWKLPCSTKIEQTNREPTWLWCVSPPSLGSYAVIPPSIGVLDKSPHILEKLTEGHLASLMHRVVEQGSPPEKRVFAEQNTVNAR